VQDPSKDPSLREQLERMRRDWDVRAAENAEYYVHVPDESGDGFEESGRRNFEEQIQPYLDLLLDGRPPAECRVVEIGCGLGRITRWIAGHFREVHGVDISAEMLARARERLRDYNVTLHLGSGADLAGLPDAHFDLAFSYIVFQHIPSREVIASYIRDTARVLRAGGGFRFQLNGWQSPEYRRAAKDSWLGESFSVAQVLNMLRDAGLEPLACEGAGSQEMVLMARKPRGPGGAARDLEERRAWEKNLESELIRLDVEPPEIAELEKAKAVIVDLGRQFDDRTRWAKSLESDLAAARHDLAGLQRAFDERTAWTQSLDAALDQARKDMADLQRQFDERTAWAQSLETDLDRARTALADLQKAFDQRTAWALEMRDELERKKT